MLPKKIHPYFYAHSLLDEERAELRGHGIALDLRNERCTGSPLPATSGKFLLNAELPIPFDNAGKMEVDFLCASARLVIELDGAQHLGDADAYRRDRRKDALLQQHGYMILRILATDVGKQLDAILETIQAALARRHATP